VLNAGIICGRISRDLNRSTIFAQQEMMRGLDLRKPHTLVAAIFHVVVVISSRRLP
jgi:hypothetical protein